VAFSNFIFRPPIITFFGRLSSVFSL
jgi:hypothetical protein